MQTAYQATTAGRFQDAVRKFQSLLLSTTLLALDDKQEITSVSINFYMLFVCKL